jgi:hypothetical protein
MARAAARLHRDQSGTISILSVFAVMLLTMLLGMVMNVGRQADGKVRMQNAADASAYSGGVVLARGMNALAFTNHMLCDVFAMTAILREASREAELAELVSQHLPRIREAWDKAVDEDFRKLNYSSFRGLAGDIEQHLRHEEDAMVAFLAWFKAFSDAARPELEYVLIEELIPKYQRAAAMTFPEIAQMATMEVARRNGVPQVRRGPMLGGFWRTDGMPVGADELYLPTLPVVDPTASNDPYYSNLARQQRKQFADRYRRNWNDFKFQGFDNFAYLLRIPTLWRNYSCALQRLLEEEYHDSNLPYQIERDANQPSFQDRFMFVGVVYWRKLPHILPGLFVQPLDSDAQAFAQTRLFVPSRRFVWHASGGGRGPTTVGLGGMAGSPIELKLDDGDPNAGGSGMRVVGKQSVPTNWNLLNQNWTCQLVPATGPNLPTILQSAPPLPEFGAANLRLPQLGDVDNQTLITITTH